MEKENLVKLTLALYKITEIFENKEPLKILLREKADNVFANSLLFFSENPDYLTKEEKNKKARQILMDIEVVKGYFEIAESQNWIKKENFLVLKREYNIIIKEIKEVFSRKEPVFSEKTTEIENKTKKWSVEDLGNERRKKILEMFKSKETIQVKDLKDIFHNITKRTLRRDFEYLLNKNLIKRRGEGNMTVYMLR